MLNSARRVIPYPNPDRSDTPDIPLHIKNVVDAADIDVIYNQGTDVARLAAAHQAGGGRFWWTTDTLIMWYDDGAAWHQVGLVESVVTANSLRAGTFAGRPAAGTVNPGTHYYATDTLATYRSNGAVWQQVVIPEATIIADSNLIGTLAARPAANTVNPGVEYFATDTLIKYRSDGATWTIVVRPPDTILSWTKLVSVVALPAGSTQTIVSTPAITFDGSTRVRIELIGRNPGGEYSGFGGFSWALVYRDAAIILETDTENSADYLSIDDTPPAGPHTYTWKITCTGNNREFRAGDGLTGHYPPYYFVVKKDI